MRNLRRAVLGLAALLLTAPVFAQRPYIGYVYPAGGQQGTTFQVNLGGQGIDGIDRAVVTGEGVTVKVLDYHRRLNPQEMTLLQEQMRLLKKAPKGSSDMMSSMMNQPSSQGGAAKIGGSPTEQMLAKIQSRIANYVQRPACQAISNVAVVEVTIAADAKPGRREIAITTLKGVSNAMAFYVGQLPEVSRKPMNTAHFQVLGKEELALRKRPDDEIEQRIKLPATLNGQIASGEVNRYRFDARKGQKLVISVLARQLVPFVADAVPGWFQPVVFLQNAQGKQVAYADDYRFKPDPVILFEVPRDGEYMLSIIDSIYRGREDFVYRISIGELPFVTSIFPLGGRAGTQASVEMRGWNLEGARLVLPPPDAAPGTHQVYAVRNKLVSNPVDFQLTDLPECASKEPNDVPAQAQKVTLPVMINGRIDKPDDVDVYQFTGKAGETIVAEVYARRLDSPLDSVLRVTDTEGRVLAINDDHEDPEAGENTHDADSYLTVKLPADGTYYVQIADSARHGGEEYDYRLRISAPQPDFALRIVPSSISVRSRSTGLVSVMVVRKDGFNLPIKLSLKNPPPGFSATPSTIGPTQPKGSLTFKAGVDETKLPIGLMIEGRAVVGKGREIAHTAVACEDRMQAFLWRHFVPADELMVLVFNPNAEHPPKRVPRVFPTGDKPAVAPATSPALQKFSKSQVASRLRQLKLLFEEGLLTDEFYHEKVLECEAAK